MDGHVQAAEHGGEHTGVGWKKMDELLLPKAVGYLCGNDEATAYQLFWDGTLRRFSMEKIGTQVPSRARGKTASRAREGGETRWRRFGSIKRRRD